MQKIYIGIATILLSLASYFVGISNIPNKLGSIGSRDAYTYKNITSANISSPTSTPVVGGAKILGSIIVASSSASVIKVYDGYSASVSDATLATSSGTLIATFPASATVGTYTFDVAVVKGIVVDAEAGFNGNYTVTFK